MKNVIRNTTSAIGMMLIGAVVLFTACEKKTIPVKQLDIQKDTSIVQEIEKSGQIGIPFPEGSIVIKGDKKHTFDITLPEGYFYVIKALDNSKDAQDTSSIISVTYTCTSGTRCDLVSLNGKCYCFMEEGCHSCDKSTAVRGLQKSEYTEVEILGLINRNAGITLLSDTPVPFDDNEMISTHKMIRGKEIIHGNAFEALFDDSEVESFFEVLASAYQENQVEPNALVFCNIFGNVAIIPYYLENDGFIAEKDGISYYLKALPGEIGSGSSTILCRCNAGNGCTLGQKTIPLIGTVYYCEAGNCASCTLDNL